MKKVTITDVAQLAQVSVSSVSRYIKDPNSINSISAVKIAKAIKELNYTPNPFAQSLKRGYTNTIGVIVPALGTYFSEVCVSLSQFFYQNKFMLFICNTDDDPEKERYYINSLSKQCAGLIIATSIDDSDFHNNLLLNYPNIIYIDRKIPGVNATSVHENVLECSNSLTEHAIMQGYEEFLLLFGPTTSFNTGLRVKGSRSAFENKGLNFDDVECYSNMTALNSIEECLKKFIQNNTTAKKCIIAYNSFIMESSVLTLRNMNLTVMQDVCIAGYALEGFKAKYHCAPYLMMQQPFDMGMLAGDALLKMLKKKGPSKTKEIIIPITLQNTY